MKLARALVLLPLLAACGDDAPPPPEEKPGEARVHGGIVGARSLGDGEDPAPEIGEVLLTIQGPLAPDAEKDVYATGQLLVGPLVAPLAGKYRKGGDLSVDAADYFLTASTRGSLLRGAYHGPTSTGQVLLVKSAVFTYCGSFDGGAEAGPLLVVEGSDGRAHGVLLSPRTGYTTALEGTRSGDALDLTSSDGDAFHLAGTVVSNESASGTVTFARGSGTFSLSTGGCSET